MQPAVTPAHKCYAVVLTMFAYNCDVKTHGTHRIEIKTRYPVPAKPNLKYHLDAYFYTPAQLQINKRRYGAESFLYDLRANTRYTTPRIPLSRVVDPQCTISPLFRLNKMLDSTGTGSSFRPEAALYEMKTLVNVYRSEKHGIRQVLSDEISTGENPDILDGILREHLYLVDTFQTALRQLKVRFMDPHVSEHLRIAIDWTDESVSLTTEIENYRLYDLFSKRDDLGTTTDLVKRRLETEALYREKSGYSSIVNPSDLARNEQLLYRESILKKWSQSAMYMNSEFAPTTAKVSQVLAGIAAALAMTFAVFATILANRLFASYSVPWSLLIVVAYIFKDRLKESIRSILGKLTPKLFSDETIQLIDPSVGKRVGLARSSVHFGYSRDVPWQVQSLRNTEDSPLKSILPREDVIHYRRRIRLNGKLLQSNHTRLDSLTEVIRLKLDKWLSEMDNSVNHLSYIKNGERKKVKALRVYHIHLLLCLTGPHAGNPPTFFFYRIVMTQDGLVRIEKINASATAST